MSIASSPIRAFLFDFGNVIAFFDHMKACDRLVQMGSALDAQGIYDFVFASSLEEEICTGRMAGSDFLKILKSKLGITATTAEIEEALCDIFWPNPDVIEVIPQLKQRGHRIVLASNTNELHWRRMKRDFAEPLRHFDALIVSHEAGAWKPDPKFFEACVAAAAVPPNACLYLDDRPDFTAAAEALGIPSLTYHSSVDLHRAFAERGVVF